MENWKDTVEIITQEGQIAVPYTWWVGDTGSRFLMALRDEKKILANRCSECGKVYVPPRKNCGQCFVDIDDWTEVGPEGTVETFTIVHFNYPVQPVKAPFAYVLVKLDGADVSLLHLVRDDIEKLGKGSRVVARFSENRTGSILDIDSFQVIEGK